MIRRNLHVGVLQQIRKYFAIEQQVQIVDALQKTVYPLGGVNTERIDVAIILLSNGNITLFNTFLEEAKIDWRDTLVRSGLGFPNWPEVLNRWGIDIN